MLQDNTENLGASPTGGVQQTAPTIESLVAKIEEYSKNLSEQGRIIAELKKTEKDIVQRNSALENQLKSITENKQPQPVQFANAAQEQPQFQIPSEFKEAIEYVKQTKTIERQKSFDNMSSVFYSFGIKQDEYEPWLDTLQNKYSVDLFEQPNANTLRALLQQEIQNTQQSIIPGGGAQGHKQSGQQPIPKEVIAQRVQEFANLYKK